MWPVTASDRMEDPGRLRRFLHDCEDADWCGGSAAALDKLFAALIDLVLQEIAWYRQARTRQRRVLLATRALAVLFGTAGLLIPLLAAADPQLFRGAAPYGYPLLAAAAAMLAVNRLFAATASHLRATAAQLELERLVATSRLQWLEWMAQNQSADGHTAAPAGAFVLMHAFVDAAYGIIDRGTLAWGQSVTDALQDDASRLPGKGGGAGHGP